MGSSSTRKCAKAHCHQVKCRSSQPAPHPGAFHRVCAHRQTALHRPPWVEDLLIFFLFLRQIVYLQCTASSAHRARSSSRRPSKIKSPAADTGAAILQVVASCSTRLTLSFCATASTAQKTKGARRGVKTTAVPERGSMTLLLRTQCGSWHDGGRARGWRVWWIGACTR